MADAAKRKLSSLFKVKEPGSSRGSSPQSSGDYSSQSGSPAMEKLGAEGDGGPRGPRRKLLTQLSEAEKSTRRSTLGSASLSQTTQHQQQQQQQQQTQPGAHHKDGTIMPVASSSHQKAVLFSSHSGAPAQPSPELETPFHKLVRQSSVQNTSGIILHNTNPSVASNSKNTIQYNTPQDSPDVSGTGSRRGANVNLSSEDKKTRRKSLLAPVQNLFASLSSDSGKKETNETSVTFGGASSKEVEHDADSRSSKRKSLGIFSSKKDKIDITTGLPMDDSQLKYQKERQRKLQKELDKIEKENSKKEKARQSKLLDVLQQTLELGEDRASLPMPPQRTAFAMSMRPPIVSS